MTDAEQVFAGLAAKLNSLNLTDAEREMFGALLGADSDGDAEVEGFSKRIYVSNLPVVQGFNIGMPPSFGFNEHELEG